jgi:hypothetical protein
MGSVTPPHRVDADCMARRNPGRLPSAIRYTARAGVTVTVNRAPWLVDDGAWRCLAHSLIVDHADRGSAVRSARAACPADLVKRSSADRGRSAGVVRARSLGGTDHRGAQCRGAWGVEIGVGAAEQTAPWPTSATTRRTEWSPTCTNQPHPPPAPRRSAVTGRWVTIWLTDPGQAALTRPARYGRRRVSSGPRQRAGGRFIVCSTVAVESSPEVLSSDRVLGALQPVVRRTGDSTVGCAASGTGSRI